MKTIDLIAMIDSGTTRHGRKPDRIEMHSFDLESIQYELMEGEATAVYASAEDVRKAMPKGAVMMFHGIPVFCTHKSTTAIWEQP